MEYASKTKHLAVVAVIAAVFLSLSLAYQSEWCSVVSSTSRPLTIEEMIALGPALGHEWGCEATGAKCTFSGGGITPAIPCCGTTAGWACQSAGAAESCEDWGTCSCSLNTCTCCEWDAPHICGKPELWECQTGSPCAPPLITVSTGSPTGVLADDPCGNLPQCTTVDQDC